MANTAYNDLFTTTLESRAGKLADNISKNNALLSKLKEKSNIRTVSGGSKILEELEYGEGDMVWYSGFDTISYTPKQLFTAAEYAIKLCAVPVAVSGEDLLKNSGHARVMELMEKRIQNAEKTMSNQLAAALYGDGTSSNGKSIGGLKLLVADAPTTGTVGNIDRSQSGNEFWRNQSATVEGLNSTNIIQARYSDPKMVDAGFTTLKYKGADVIFDGGQGGYCPENHMYFLNTNYLYLRPHKDRNMKVIGGDRMAINQDAMYRIIGWAGNMTMSNAALQGVLINTPAA